MYKKPLIVFEGIETSGKTLHLDIVVRYLKKKKYTPSPEEISSNPRSKSAIMRSVIKL